MFRKIIEKKQKENELKKDWFNARKALVVPVGKYDFKTVGCIKLVCSVDCSNLDEWKYTKMPETTLKVNYVFIKYCREFDPHNPQFRCENKTCPAYYAYLNYIRALEALQAVQQNKTK